MKEFNDAELYQYIKMYNCSTYLKKPFFYLMEIIVNNGNWDLFLPKVLLLFFFRKTNEKTKRQEKYALHNAFVNSLFVMGGFHE